MNVLNGTEQWLRTYNEQYQTNMERARERGNEIYKQWSMYIKAPESRYKNALCIDVRMRKVYDTPSPVEVKYGIAKRMVGGEAGADTHVATFTFAHPDLDRFTYDYLQVPCKVLLDVRKVDKLIAAFYEKTTN